MKALWKTLTLVALTSVIAGCFGPPPPYRGNQPQRQRYSLDNPPPGNDPNIAAGNRYVQQQLPPTTPGTDPNGLIDPGLPLDPSAPTGPEATNPGASAPTTDPTVPPVTATEPPKPQPPAELPYGKPVPGKRGFVYSPYDSSAGFVDVQGIAPGTKVRCPYTGKIFRVP